MLTPTPTQFFPRSTLLQNVFLQLRAVPDAGHVAPPAGTQTQATVRTLPLTRQEWAGLVRSGYVQRSRGALEYLQTARASGKTFRGIIKPSPTMFRPPLGTIDGRSASDPSPIQRAVDRNVVAAKLNRAVSLHRAQAMALRAPTPRVGDIGGTVSGDSLGTSSRAVQTRASSAPAPRTVQPKPLALPAGMSPLHVVLGLAAVVMFL